MVQRPTVNEKIRVAHLIYSENIGGSEMVAANVCSLLDEERFESMVLFMLRSRGRMPEILNCMGVDHAKLNMFWRRVPFESFYLKAMLNRYQIDILHVHHIPLYLRIKKAVRLSRVKGVIFTEHAKYSITRSEKLQLGCVEAARNADFFTVVSRDLKEYFMKSLNINDEDIQVIQNGVDTKKFFPSACEELRQEIVPNGFSGKLLLHVGRLTEAKDHNTLLIAIKRLVEKGCDLCLVLVGEGELRGEIEQKIKELELDRHVVMLGLRSDVDRLLRCADLFVISSAREGLPMVLMEAMACQLPVVSTSVGGIGEIVVDGESGFLVQPSSADQLASAMGKVLSDDALSRNMGVKARQTILAEYSLQKAIERYSHLYQKIMDGANSAACI